MELKRHLPPNRTFEQVKHHYLIEREIAARLMATDREGRKAIYATMYDELFRKVPDHPRLTRRQNDQVTEAVNRTKLALVERYLDASTVFLEFAPGDCRFSTTVAEKVRFAYGLDISDQRRPDLTYPENFELVVYDGYSLDKIQDSSIDVIFSDQLVEHFHPEDTRHHFELAHRLLRPGGIYVLRTPHILTGPHDISKYFCDAPEGFHLKEWTHKEISGLLSDVGYARYSPVWFRKGFSIKLPFFYFLSAESVLRRLPRRHARKLAGLLVPSVYGIAQK